MALLLVFALPLAGLLVVLLTAGGWRAARRPAPLAVMLVASALMAVALLALSDPGALLEDFRGAYLRAGREVLAHGPAGLAPMLERGVDGFVNLPIVAYLFWPFAALPPLLTGLLFTALGVGCVLAAWYALVRALLLDRAAALTLLFVFAASGPLMNSVREGNLTHFLLWPLAVAMLQIRRDAQFRAGVLLGVAAVIKLPLLLLGVYYLLTGRWRVALGGALVCALAGVASLAVFGWGMHVQWYTQCIQPFAQDPMPAFNVQSVQAFVGRLQVGAEGLHEWRTVPIDAGLALASKALVALIYGTVLLGLWQVWRRGGLPWTGRTDAPAMACSDAEFMLIVALACVTSPLTWVHYYCWFLLPAAFFVQAMQEGEEGGAARHAVGWFALLACSLPVVTLPLATSAPAQWYARTLVSLPLAGALAWMLWIWLGIRAPRSRRALAAAPQARFLGPKP